MLRHKCQKSESGMNERDTMKITRKAYAKINLGLDVTGRRADGYHMVRMIMQNVDLYDTLTFEESAEKGIRLYTSSPSIPADEHNLIWKVCALLMDKYHIESGVTVTLEKRIPVAAGMAGGSTDGAAAFMGMNELFALGLSGQEMCEMAVRLGADIPYCILGGTALAEGIGEILTPLPDMPECAIIIAKPAIGVSTKWVYTELDSREIASHPDIDGIRDAIARGDLQSVQKLLGNVLEPVTTARYTVITEIEQIMKTHGALNAMMSGSGPTVFGIYTDQAAAQESYQALEKSGLCPELYLSRPINPKQ